MTQQVIAPLAGNIWSINVSVGTVIEEDDEILVIEALKMETPIYAPCAGTVAEIRVNKGDQVEEDDILAVIA